MKRSLRIFSASFCFAGSGRGSRRMTSIGAATGAGFGAGSSGFGGGSPGFAGGELSGLPATATFPSWMSLLSWLTALRRSMLSFCFSGEPISWRTKYLIRASSSLNPASMKASTRDQFGRMVGRLQEKF
jgi:hypothetical protein